jgi:hypothetical protein
MDNEVKKEIEDLKRRLQELETYVTQKKLQQISFPLDKVSQDIIANL